MHSIDSDKTNAFSAFSSAIFVHETTLDIGQEKVEGVTKLRNEIFVISSLFKHQKEFYYSTCPGSELKVFEGKEHFLLLRKFKLTDIHLPINIVSSEHENALYILGCITPCRYGRRDQYRCAWRIDQNEEIKSNAIIWLEFKHDFIPNSISMSKRGHLLMASSKPSPSLRIYGSDSQLQHFIFLHERIKYPLHAVDSSTGNFIISHKLVKNKKCFLEEQSANIWKYSEELAISVLSRDGKTIISNFDAENEEQRLSTLIYSDLFPWFDCFDAGYLCIDSCDQVSVADQYNSRVILLDPDLHFKQILIPSTNYKGEKSEKSFHLDPHRIIYDEVRKQLIVSGSSESRECGDDVCLFRLK